MPDKNVQLPDGRVVAFPDSMADADISAVIKKQLEPKAPGVTPTKDTLADAFAATHWGAPMGSEKEAAGNLPMIAATAASGAAGPEAGVITRILLGMLGAGVASPVKQKLQGSPITAKETAVDTATGAIPGAVEGLGGFISGLKNTLTKAIFTGTVDAVGKPEMTTLARSILHPTELPENVVRAVVPPPEEAIAAAKAQAGEANAAKLESQMNEAQMARQKELAQWERLRNQEAQSLMTRGRQQAILDAQAARSAPPPQASSPFAGGTSTDISNLGALSKAPVEPLQGRLSLFQSSTGTTATGPQGPFVSKFAPPEAPRIVTPESAPPPINKTLVSYDRGLLVEMAKKGDLNALRELIRNPGNIDVASAVPNSRYLLEANRPTNIYGGPQQ